MECPFCNAEISESARKCKHCGEWVQQPPAGSTTPAVVAEKKAGGSENFMFGVIVVLTIGLVGTLGYFLFRPPPPPPPMCPLHNVPITSTHPGPCTYQHGELVFSNDLHEGDVTVTVETGHEQGRFCDHSQVEVARVLHHAEVDIFSDIAVGKVHFRVKSDEGETYRGHVPIGARDQVKCGVARGPAGELTCYVTVEDHDTEEGHDD